MNVVFLESYYKGINGAPKSMLSLAQGLANQGYAITIGVSKNGELSSEATRLELGTIDFSVPSSLLQSRRNLNPLMWLKYLMELFFYWVRLKDDLKNYDAICVNDIRSMLFYLPILFKNRNRVIWFVRINDRLKFITKIASLLSSKIVLVSSDCMSMFSSLEKRFIKNKVLTINTGFVFRDLDYKVVEEIKADYISFNKIFITVGAICKRKNQKSLIRAFAHSFDKNSILLILGSPTNEYDRDYLKELKHEVEFYGIKNNVRFLGHTEYVYEYLSVADTFLFSSKKEGLPRSVVEALYHNCFICSSNVEGISDILRCENLGYFTDISPSHPHFQDNFNELVKKSFERTCNAGSDFVKENFSYSKFVNRVELLLQKDV